MTEPTARERADTILESCRRNKKRGVPEWFEGFTGDIITAFAAEIEAAEARGLSAGPGWRPIETAPKDGTRILVWSEFRGNMAASMHEKTTCDLTYWNDLNGGGWVRHTWATPTHWQPLPAAPIPTNPEAGR